VLVAMSRFMSVVKHGIICSGASIIITNGVEGSYPLVQANVRRALHITASNLRTHLFVWHATEHLLSELCTPNQEINVSKKHV
jgi:hypothetical protein